ncbi:hypothetical protein L210DRAFT_958266 [Boletus edulis BED1]|uniref:Protein OS-9 homolog n=1 Tax=Boletus edulis BED1 TaxID=1328754 RepID=A0AAD4C3K8_BOLED|nr:hypothetical protein L210DRAFT_958266 [Boletus edulis BED1]
MRRSALVAFALSPIALGRARLLYSGPEDPYAFPKYRVTFLNDFPVLNETARRWIQDGLRGGEQEFLGESWDPPAWYPQAGMKEIGSSETGTFREAPNISQSETSDYSLQHMKMGPDNAFLCLIPPAHNAGTTTEDFDGDATLRNSWSLLQPLSGKCLYHRQTWFTYSYCHNQEIRQFKELTPTQLPTGPYEPAEDPQWEAFTLGRSPVAQDDRADVVVADQLHHATNLEVAHGPGSRYLVQRWGDGTFCDKTGKPREVEVQFHCSMTMSDSILLIREAKTCSYVLVVQTPRLCGEPGFRSHLETRDETLIRCRQIINPTSGQVPASESTQLEQRQTGEQINLNEFDHPLHLLNRKSRFTIPTPPPLQSSLESGSGDIDNSQWEDIWKRAVEALMKSPDLQALGGNNPQVFFDRGENGEIVIEILEEIPMEGSGDGAVQGDVTAEEYAQLRDALRNAVFDMRRDRETEGEGDQNWEEEEDEEGSRNTRDEL